MEWTLPPNPQLILLTDKCILVEVDKNPPSVNDIIKIVKSLKNGTCYLVLYWHMCHWKFLLPFFIFQVD